jgi:SAM-dependent methyltransferase
VKGLNLERLTIRLAGLPGPTDYGAYAAYMAARYAGGLRGKRVLVVGCNRGEDCRHFADMGAGELHGLDVIEDVGVDFRGPTYHRASAEAIDLPDDRFDLVFAVATLEHVPRVEPAFAEMARVCAPNGVVYSVAAPLWNSSYGHHKGELFAGHPWVHLRLDRDGIVALCRREGISSPDEHSIDEHVDYMLDDRFFNQTPARVYVQACACLAGVELIRNELAYDEPDDLTPELESELRGAGYPRDELLASVHTVVARKRPFARPADLSRTLRTRVRGALLERATRRR